jgi:hypothetical protein
MPSARLVNSDDLGALLALFADCDVSQSAEPERARKIWAQTLAREGLLVFVSDEDSRIVSTCMLITAPNLLRGGQQHFQGRGHGRPDRCALAEAWRRARFDLTNE